MFVDEDNGSRMAAFLVGKYDLGWEFPGTMNRSDWVQLVEPLKKRRPGLKIAEFPSNVVNLIDMRTDKPPFNDVRVRQAVSLALDRKGMVDATLEGVGAVNGPLPAALSEWALPIAELGESARYYRHDPAEARRLLAAAGYPNGLPASVCFATYGSRRFSSPTASSSASTTVASHGTGATSAIPLSTTCSSASGAPPISRAGGR